ncbi:MAG: phage terminase large subunit [Planctomycetaceae bacterium]
MLASRPTIGRQNLNTKIIARFNPLSWQVEPWRDTSPVVLFTGSAGGGKSRLAAEKLHGYMKRYPGAMGLMLRKTRDSMTNSTVLFMDRAVIGRDPQVRHYPSKHRFEYDNGSILAYGGMADEQQREQIRSIGQDGALDIVWMEEATRFVEDDYNEILTRMRGKAAPWLQIVLTTNPDSPTHWIYKRLISGGGAKVYYSSATDNWHNPASYSETLAGLTGVLHKRLALGQWIQAEGAVYDTFDQAIHVVDRFDIPAEWRRIRAIDFGYTNAFVCQWWAMDGDGRAYRYREIYHTRKLVEDHARHIVRLSEGEKIEATVADHDAEDRATLEKYGVTTRPAKKDVSPGIQAVQSRLKIANDGKPRLFLMRGSSVEYDPNLEHDKRPTCTEDEFTGYVWPKDPSGRIVKEAPIKENDHGMDAMRYAVMYLDGPRGVFVG